MSEENAVKCGAPEVSWFETHNDIKLYLRKWKCEGTPRGFINIVHGMGEHGGRYDGLGRFLSGAGFEVWAVDQRGHGRTADAAVNNEANGGLLGHCADRGGATKVLLDINRVNERLRAQNPAVPLFLLGHSWGSFMVQNYIEFAKTPFAGCILSGTRGPGGPEVFWGLMFVKLLVALKGGRYRSSFVNHLAFGAANRLFAPARTDFDWLSRDEKVVNAFIADALCGKLPTAAFFRDMLSVLSRIHRSRNLDKIKRTLPIYIIGGTKDPIGGCGENVRALAKKYVKIKIRDLELALYPDARHECFNEINQAEVKNELLQWLEKHL
jgi:alpha-beta hydrolase superfamily lysophospholipase